MVMDIPMMWVMLLSFFAIASLVLWILVLVDQAKKRRWFWFVLTLLFNILWVVYLIVILVRGERFLSSKKKKRR